MNDIRGIVPPMVTPFTSDDGIDVGAIRADVKYLIEEQGSTGLRSVEVREKVIRLLRKRHD